MTEREHESSGSLKGLYGTVWHYAAGMRPRVVVFVALLVLSQAVRLTVPWFFGEAVNALQRQGTEGLGTATRYLLYMLAAVCASWVMHGPARIMERFTGLTIRQRFADFLYARAIAMPVRWHEQHHSGDTLHRITKATGSLFTFAQNQFIYIQNVVSVIGPIIALCLLSWVTGTVAFVGYFIIGLFVVRIDRVMVRLIREENAAERRYHSALVDCLGNVATVLTLRLQEPTRRMLASRLQEVFSPLRRAIVFNEAKWAGLDLLNNALRTGLVALFAYLEWRHTGYVTVGTAVMVHQYSQQIGTVVAAMAVHWTDLVRQKTDVAAVNELLQGTSRPSDSAPLPAGWREIAVRDVCFTHPNARQSHPTLDAAALVLRRGRRIALVGESGAGKSSLLRVLGGLIEPQSISILVDGHAHGELRHLGRAAMLLPQDPEVFEGTVRENICMGISYSDAEVARACELSCFAPVAAALPEGLETRISERGLNLSGGQKQRLALARGILAIRDAGLLFLDEPTSSVDPTTEALIYDGIMRAFPDACIVSSVHRLHLLDRFDEIVLMDSGRAIDSGTPAEVLARNPRHFGSSSPSAPPRAA